jgi:hypothetical protein
MEIHISDRTHKFQNKTGLDAKDNSELYKSKQVNSVVLEYALPFTEFNRKNDENTIGDASGCFHNFSKILGERSKKILNKSPIHIISSIHFHLYCAENGKDDSSSKNHLKS